MKSSKLLKSIFAFALFGLSTAHADGIVGANNDIAVSVQRNNLIQETLVIKNISDSNIDALHLTIGSKGQGAFNYPKIKSGNDVSCILVSKGSPLLPRQSCALTLLKKKTKLVVGKTSTELDIAINNGNDPLRLKVNAGVGLYATGKFTFAGKTKARNFAMWDGTQWVAITDQYRNGITGYAYSMIYDDKLKSLVLGGDMTMAASVQVNNLARYWGRQDGYAVWDDFNGGTNGTVNTLSLPVDGGTNYLYFIGGNFTIAGGVSANHIAYAACPTDGGICSFNTLGNGIDFSPNTLSTSYGGPAYFRIYAGGPAAGSQYKGIATWWEGEELDGEKPNNNQDPAWSGLAQGVNGDVQSTLMPDRHAKVYVSGTFTQAGGIPANGIAEWDGQSWSNPFKFPAQDVQNVSLSAYGNNLYAYGHFTLPDGTFGLAEWDGSSWTNVGGGVYNDGGFVKSVYSMIFDGAGNLYIGGLFRGVGSPVLKVGSIAEWDGTQWHTLNGGVTDVLARVYAIALAPYLNVSSWQ